MFIKSGQNRFLQSESDFYVKKFFQLFYTMIWFAEMMIVMWVFLVFIIFHVLSNNQLVYSRN